MARINGSFYHDLSNHSNAAGNFTASPPAAHQYPYYVSLTSYCMFPVVLFSVALNIEILVTFLRHRRLLTPFSIHVFNLTMINILNGAVYEVFHLTHNLDRSGYYGNRALCSSNLYTQWTLAFLPAMQHTVICVDRWLAIFLPHWYRTKTMKFGVIATITAVCYDQALYLPLFVADTTRYSPSNALCDSTVAWRNYQPFVRFAIILLPQAVLLLGYPLLLYKLWTRRRKVMKIRAAAAVATAENGVARVIVPKSTAVTKGSDQQLVVCLVAMQLLFWAPNTFLAVINMAGYSATFPRLDVIAAIAYGLPSFLLITDPMAYLIFMRELRGEVMRDVIRVFKLDGDKEVQSVATSAT